MKKTFAIARYLLSVHILALTILSLLRFILYLSYQPAADVENKGKLLAQALLKGIQFDNVIACYTVALPLIILSIFALCNKIPKAVIRITNVYFILFYSVVFCISVADIPYFAYYFSHMGASIFNFMKFGGDTAGMIFQESSYYIYIALLIVVILAFAVLTVLFGKKAIKSGKTNIGRNEYKFYIPVVIIIWGLCFAGLRGGFERYPLRIGSAYFSNNSFFNQLGINPAFFMIKSWSTKQKEINFLENVMSDEAAITFAKKELNVPDSIDHFNPIARYVKPEGDSISPNIVIILMESMSTEYLKCEYAGKNLMPYLNGLIDRSYYFENFYSAGVHTNNGIASTLYGFPPHFERTMMGSQVTHYTGLPVTLRNLGYQTQFFLTSNPQYDNMNSFLYENGFDRVYSEYDYPKEKIVNNFGVQDQYLFEYGIERLNEASEKNRPFFATFMTVSNHPPLVIPDEFKDKADTDFLRIIAYVDSTLQYFMETAEKQSWYENTIFVLLGDHGKVMGEQPYEMSLTYNHVPFIIYSPLFNDMPRRMNQYAGQMDVFPTIMGFLNHSYVNNSMGTDLFRSRRPYTYFVSDNRLGCIDGDFFYVYATDTKSEWLYKYRDNDATNHIQQYKSIADSMKTYSTSMMLTSDYLVRNKMTGVEPDKQ